MKVKATTDGTAEPHRREAERGTHSLTASFQAGSTSPRAAGQGSWGRKQGGGGGRAGTPRSPRSGSSLVSESLGNSTYVFCALFFMYFIFQ